MISLHFKPGSRILRAAEEAIPGDVWVRMRRVPVLKTRDIPAKANFVLFGGKAAPEIKLEWWAANKGGCVLCLPEADEYLGRQARAAMVSDTDLFLIDASLRKLRA